MPLLLFLLTTLATAQSAPVPTAPQLSPQSAYDQAMHPLEITRNAITNWSDAETTALAIAVKQATEACSARTPGQFTGDDLIAYARLCALGQQWPTVLTAASSYITSTDASKPQLSQAYAYQVGAALHTNDPKAILADSVAMLNAVPYTSITDETMYGALHYLQLAFTPEAITSTRPVSPSSLRLFEIRDPPRPRQRSRPLSPSILSTPAASPSPRSSSSSIIRRPPQKP